MATATAVAGAPGAETCNLEVQVLGERASDFRSSVNGLLELLELMCTSLLFRKKDSRGGLLYSLRQMQQSKGERASEYAEKSENLKTDYRNLIRSHTSATRVQTLANGQNEFGLKCQPSNPESVQLSFREAKHYQK